VVTVPESAGASGVREVLTRYEGGATCKAL
jgi:hypothetical protein